MPPRCAIARQRFHRGRTRVINHTLVALPREPSHHVGAHASQPDHPKLHLTLLISREHATGRRTMAAA